MFRLSLFLAWRQLLHRSRGSLGGLAGVCVAVVLMFMQLGFRNALYDSALNIPAALDADLFITAPQYLSLAFSPPWHARNLLMEARTVPGVADASPVYAFSGQLRSPRTGTNMSGWILAFDLDKPVFTAPEINAQINRLRLPNSALLDSLSRYDYTLLRDRLNAGEPATVAVHQPGATMAPVIELAGMFTLGPSFTIDGLVITSDLNYHRFLNLPLDRVSLGLVKLAPGAELEPTRQALSTRMGDRAKVSTRAEYLAAEKRFYATRTPIGMIFNIGLFVGVVVGVVFISQVLHAVIDSNLREYAVLVAMGYQRSFFQLIVFEIAAVISLLTFLPSLVFSAVLYGLAGWATNLPLVLKPGAVIGVFAVVVIMGNVSALLALRRLKSANPLELFS